MDSLMCLLQVLIYTLMLVGLIIIGITHTVMGYIGFGGLLVLSIFIFGIASLVRSSWKEYLEEKNK